MQKSASQILHEAANIFEKDDAVITSDCALAVAVGMNKDQLYEATMEVLNDYNFTSSAKLHVIADFLEKQEEAEETFEPSYDELYKAAIERLALVYDNALTSHINDPSKDVCNLVQYKEFLNERALVLSIFDKSAMEVMRDVRAASKLLGSYF